MKSHTKKLMLFLVLLTNGIITTSAQYYCGISHPDNQEDILLDIRNCFSEGIGIPIDDIADFLSAESGWYDSEVPVPSINFASYSDMEFRVDWDDVLGASMYRVRSLNLETVIEAVDSWPNESSVKFLVEYEQLYLSLYATIFWDGTNFQKSADVIIIDELPVIRDTPVYDCNCGSTLNSKTNGRSTGSNEEYLKNNIQLYPNPATDEVQLAYHIEEAQEVSIWLTDALGTTSNLLQAPVKRSKGAHLLQVPISHLSAGWYHCIVKTESTQWHSTFLKHK